MIRTFVLSASLALGLATAADAALSPAPLGAGSAVVKVAEGCGEGFWRAPNGACHPMAKNRVCPVGFHLGTEGEKCWPN